MKNAVSVKNRILDISVNLARVGNWTADSYKQKQQLVTYFLDQTNTYLKEIRQSKLSEEGRELIQHFVGEFNKLRQEKISEANKELWAERALTWANILQHRAKLA